MTRTQKLLRLLSTALIAALVAGGDKACEYSCLGFGDCEAACPFGAIHVVEGRLAAVNEEKCVGCGVCTTKCKFDAIRLVRVTDNPGEVYEKLMLESGKNVARRVKEIAVKRVARPRSK